ncbi:hypothetical protein GGR53DRAFT_525479 [Hypoxylon sp. FL1150]|nr:hypothetical protein GGR53DRAFT_525479 [Hypoxylon sp. FL1150]
MGSGFFATRDIAAGTIILLDTWLLCLPLNREKWSGSFELFADAYYSAPSSIASLIDDAAPHPTNFEDLRPMLMAQADKWLERKFRRPVCQRDYWLPLAEKIVRAYCTFKNNACEVSDTPEEAFYPTYSRFNHSCDPNIGWSFEGEPDYLIRIYAMRDVKAGEQLFISYTDHLSNRQSPLPLESRQKLTQRNWGFTCACSRCIAEE